MLFRTEIEPPVWEQKITYNSRIMLMGSCFVTHIGEKLRQMRFIANTNPTGVQYNPASIAQTLQMLQSGIPLTIQDLLCHHEVYFSYTHHSSFSDVDAHQCLQKINNSIEEGHQFLQQSDFLIITLGTARVHRLKKTQQVVANCHKMLRSLFDCQLLSVDAAAAVLDAMITSLHNLRPQMNVVFSVSPVRHWKDGAHGNQISKATLLLAIEQMVQQHKNVVYFPAYEIVLDDLRDYRYYAADMLHLNPTAVDYIWEKFVLSTMDKTARTLLPEVERYNAMLQHRPMFPQSVDYYRFIAKRDEALAQLRKKLPEHFC
ncbi:hypothetical protein AGMMS4956_15250 [Bacteroidia bacterium]|nr:hypothetical protein AGMMS4956_15250 [Bacteroidia bacterium]